MDDNKLNLLNLYENLTDKEKEKFIELIIKELNKKIAKYDNLILQT